MTKVVPFTSVMVSGDMVNCGSMQVNSGGMNGTSSEDQVISYDALANVTFAPGTDIQPSCDPLKLSDHAGIDTADVVLNQANEWLPAEEVDVATNTGPAVSAQNTV